MRKIYDVVIIGGGIMGLLGAYETLRGGRSVALVERAKIGNANAGSSGITRSMRTDYEAPIYATLAGQAWDKWRSLEVELGARLIIPAGCLNLSDGTADSQPYALAATRWLASNERAARVFQSATSLQQAYPQFQNFDYGVLERKAGLGFPRVALGELVDTLRSAKGMTIFEDTVVETVRCSNDAVKVACLNGQTLRARRVVIAAGLGTPNLLEKIEGSSYRLALTADRPSECVYYIPKKAPLYEAAVLPVFAYLDEGIYGHPIVAGVTKGVKIGRYNPPTTVNSAFRKNVLTIDAFVKRYMPDLARNADVLPVTDTDQCAYDNTPDDGFVIGQVPKMQDIFIAAGFCGTGYKFASVIGEMISDFACARKQRYSIEPFDPGRFTSNGLNDEAE